MNKILKVITLIIVIGGITGVYYYQSKSLLLETIVYQVMPPTIDEITIEANKAIAQRIVLLQNEVIADLGEGCETKGVKEPDSALVLDTNNKMSIGRYQWQRESVIYYYEKFYGESIGMLEALEIAIDYERATELTRDVLFNEPNGYKNWWTCSQRLNIADRVSIINSLN